VSGGGGGGRGGRRGVLFDRAHALTLPPFPGVEDSDEYGVVGTDDGVVESAEIEFA
jgi:hypothetical protein